MKQLLANILLLAFSNPFLTAYEVPHALVEVFKPRGLRVSIPDGEGIKLFAFHGKVNEEMNGREGGFFSRDILKAKNGRWTFYEPTAELKVGDILYYWTYVDYFDGKNKLGYTKDDQEFEVTELLEKSDSTDCKESVTISQNKKTCRRKMIFSEDFNDLNATVWKPEIKFAEAPDYEFVIYGNNAKNIALKNGNLEIRPLPSEEVYGPEFVRSEINLGDKCTGKPGTLECEQTASGRFILPPVASAQITTKNRFSFKYGRVEIRAKLPSGDWIYPEIYLNPQNEDYGPDYESGQIRVAFIQGNSDKLRKLEGGCILGSPTNARNYVMKNIQKNEGSWCNDFHIFSLIWRPNQITISVDDQVYGTIDPPNGGFAQMDGGNHKWHTGSTFAPFDKEMYLTIGVGVGGFNFEDCENCSKPWKNKAVLGQKNFHRAKSSWLPTWGNGSAFQVDYVKVYAL